MNQKITLHRGDALEVLERLSDNSIEALVTDPPAGIGFMGKEWDKDKGGRDNWIAWLTSIMLQVYRVLKPGAHGFVWALPRTSHWTATALEDAGFEVRDCVYHVFGSGFPKSHDIAKGIDKQNGDEKKRPVSRPNPSCRKEQTGPNGWVNAERPEYKTSAASAASAAWEGWGTALKPAVECYWLIRKPCSEKTVAKNVLKWGTGAINIDTCRIGFSGEKDLAAAAAHRSLKDQNKGRTAYGKFDNGPESLQPYLEKMGQGRFPSHLILDEVSAEMMDEQSGPCKTGGANRKNSGFQNQMVGGKVTRPINTFLECDGAGASRFFYVAKTSKAERNAGLDGDSVEQNTHPTVKPIKLMSYLIRLITPPCGTVLDPFMGSGSTGVAAVKEGFRFEGIELDADYFRIAKKRITSQTKPA